MSSGLLDSSDALGAVVAALVGVAAGLPARRLVQAMPNPRGSAPESDVFRDVSEAPRLWLRVAIVGALSGAVIGWRIGWTPALAPWLPLVAVCPLLGYVDLCTRLLPTALIRPAYIAVVVLVVVAAAGDRSGVGLRHAAIGWALMGGFYVLLWYLGPPGLGYGDVRLSGLLALALGYLGLAEVVTGLYMGFLLGGLTSLALIVTHRATVRSEIPFGPFMMLGALVGLLWGPAMSGWLGAF